jgi:hypothetical protein
MTGPASGTPAGESAAQPLSARLAGARRRGLLGRTAQLALVRELLHPQDRGLRVLWLHGVGGIGKTTLLDAYAVTAKELGWHVIRFDGRELRDAAHRLGEQLRTPLPAVLIVDGCEELGALEQDLFERELPQAPDGLRMVFAGRLPPRGRWRDDAGWRAVVCVHAVPELDRTSADQVLAEGGMPEPVRQRWIALTRGHPLALALAVESYRQDSTAALTPAGPDPEYVNRLLERFIDSLPSTRHRMALELCALARTTSEDLLRSFVGDKAPELFAWLRGLSFTQSTSQGLVPHDLVRELVTEDLRWRDAPAFRRYRHQMARHFIARMREAPNLQVFVDYLHLRRHAAFGDGYFSVQPDHALYGDALRAADTDAVRALVEAAEGSASGEQVDAWMRAQPQAFTVFRDADGIAGFMADLELRGEAWQSPLVEADPVLRQARLLVTELDRSHTSPEDASVLRWWLQRDGLHQPGPVQNLIQARCMLLWASRTPLRWSLIPNTRAAFWRGHFEPIHFALYPAHAVRLGALDFVPYVRDWQRFPFWDWITSSGERLLAPEPVATPRIDAPRLSELLRRALRDFASDARLGQSPLCALLSCDAEGLRDRLRAEFAALEREPRGAPLRQILQVSFLSGCPSQESAAERLKLPFGTYRHRLRAAEKLLAERMRQALGIEPAD